MILHIPLDKVYIIVYTLNRGDFNANSKIIYQRQQSGGAASERVMGNEVYAQKIGETVILVPKDKVWETFIEGLNGFTEDYFEAVESGRADEIQSERESL